MRLRPFANLCQLRELQVDPLYSRKRFLDRMLVQAAAGAGGGGSRATLVQHGKKVPVGGSGGRGGSVVVTASQGVLGLMRLSHRQLRAEDGGPGLSNRAGAKGADCEITVPTGTLVYRVRGSKQTLLGDLVKDRQRIVLLEGGAGGVGIRDARPGIVFDDARRQGQEGPTGQFLLELKMIADVGLLGLPNIGKSTLLAALTQAAPQISNYEFTTLHPNVGRVLFEDGWGLTVSDLPGIIEDSSKGRGLGLEFLKHIERNRMLLAMVDLTAELPASQQLQLLLAELSAYDPSLLGKPMLVAANKMDACADWQTKLGQLQASTPLECLPISARDAQGLGQLVVKCRALIEGD
jgi:GTP-binding protein